VAAKNKQTNKKNESLREHPLGFALLFCERKKKKKIKE